MDRPRFVESLVFPGEDQNLHRTRGDSTESWLPPWEDWRPSGLNLDVDVKRGLQRGMNRLKRALAAETESRTIVTTLHLLVLNES
jgi:hypothetical protein